MHLRCSSEDQLPRELQSPIAVAEHLLDDNASGASDTPPSDSTEGESTDAPAADSPVTVEKVCVISLLSQINLC